MSLYRDGEEVEVEFAPEWAGLLAIRFYQTPPLPGANYVRRPAYVYESRDPQEVLEIILALRQGFLEMTGRDTLEL